MKLRALFDRIVSHRFLVPLLVFAGCVGLFKQQLFPTDPGFGERGSITFELMANRIVFGMRSHAYAEVDSYSINRVPLYLHGSDSTTFLYLARRMGGPIYSLIYPNGQNGVVPLSEVRVRGLPRMSVNAYDWAGYRRRLRPTSTDELTGAFVVWLPMALWPDITIGGVAHFVNFLKFAALLTMVIVLVFLGIKTRYVMLMSFLSVSLLAVVNSKGAFEVYPMVMPFLACLLSLFALEIKKEGAEGSGNRKLVVLFAVAFVHGFLILVTLHVRTMYTPILLASIAAYLAALWRVAKGRKLLTLGVRVAGLSLGVSTYWFWWVAPMQATAMEEGGNAWSHPVWHSVVLSLNMPDNPLARRERILWRNDPPGVYLAQKVNPRVFQLYTKEYSKALRQYYFSLWRRFPAEMARLYWRKLKYAGDFTQLEQIDRRKGVRLNRGLLKDFDWIHTPESYAGGGVVGAALRTLSRISHGFWWLLLSAGAMVWGVRKFSSDPPVLFLFVSFGIAGTLDLISAALVLSRLTLTAHSFFPLWAPVCLGIWSCVIAGYLRNRWFVSKHQPAEQRQRPAGN